MELPSPNTVASMLAAPATRIATLDALEQHTGPHEAALALAAASALTDLLCLDGAEVPHALYQRVGLLRGRLVLEAEDVLAMSDAYLGDGRYARELTAPSVGQGGLRSKSAAQLDRDDALSYACARSRACHPPFLRASNRRLFSVAFRCPDPGVRRSAAACACLLAASPFF